MKHFEAPELEVQKYEIANVITVSGDGPIEGGGGNGNYGGEVWD
jgi:hypothetical protein